MPTFHLRPCFYNLFCGFSLVGFSALVGREWLGNAPHLPGTVPHGTMTVSSLRVLSVEGGRVVVFIIPTYPNRPLGFLLLSLIFVVTGALVMFPRIKIILLNFTNFVYCKDFNN